MKRLLAAGDCPKAIYQVSRVFRRDEQGPLHNPEFTLLEWYAVDQSYAEGMAWTSEVCEAMLGRGPANCLSLWRSLPAACRRRSTRCRTSRRWRRRPRPCPSPPPESLSTDDRDGWLDWLLDGVGAAELGQRTVRRSFTTIRRRRRRWRGCGRAIRRWPSGSSCTSPASSWPTAITNSWTPASCGDVTRRPTPSRLADGKSSLPEPARLLAAMEFGLPPAGRRGLGLRPPGDVGRRRRQRRRGDRVSLRSSVKRPTKGRGTVFLPGKPGLGRVGGLYLAQRRGILKPVLPCLL